MKKKLKLSTAVLVILFLVLISGCLGQGDSDDDGLADSIESNGWDIIIFYADGTEKEIHVRSDPYKKDTDRDGLSDYEEFEQIGILDPSSADTDGDGLSDYEEVKIYNTSPNKQDSEIWPDGLLDGIEIKGWNITVEGVTKRVSSDPKLYDTDGDGLSDYEEWQNLTDPSSADSDSDGFTDLIDIYPCKDLKIKFILENISLSEDYGKKAKVYFIIQPERSEAKRTSFMEIENGSEINLTDFVEITNLPDDKSLYPINIQISAFDNNTQETISQYVIGYGFVTVKVDKSLRINDGYSSFEFEFNPEESERTFNLSGDDLSISFKTYVEGD
ncbi:MAG: hypothetical protein DRN25_04180 [Thermoplasmata archaeon]|nr:MAG: hypothetical protein DRN25_04180 [Thermoplasmata archaeon]